MTPAPAPAQAAARRDGFDESRGKRVPDAPCAALGKVSPGRIRESPIVALNVSL